MTTVFTHHDMDHSKNHCIVLPERACKSTSAYAAVCLLFFLSYGHLGKALVKEVLISPFWEYFHTHTFIFPFGKHNPIRFFLSKPWHLLCAKELCKAALFAPLGLTGLKCFLLLLLFICFQVSCVHLLLWSHILAYSVIFLLLVVLYRQFLMVVLNPRSWTSQTVSILWSLMTLGWRNHLFSVT